MKALELKELLSDYLRKNGTEAFTKIVSDAIDETGAHKSTIADTRNKFEKKFKFLSDINLTER